MSINKLSGFMVYWVDITGGDFFPFHSHYNMDEMTDALAHMENLRKSPDVAYVTMVSQNPQHVGKAGASTVLPDDYSWSKRHRGDGPVVLELRAILGDKNGQ
jgi:hypothetical protein